MNVYIQYSISSLLIHHIKTGFEDNALDLFHLCTDGCEQKQCDFYGVCESDSAGGTKCVCPKNCTFEVPTIKRMQMKTNFSIFC